MQRQIKINTLRQWTQLIENVLRSIASFNEHQLGMDIDSLEAYVRAYNNSFPRGVFNYTAKRPNVNTLEIFIDEELALSITMCEIHDLIINENY